MAKKKDDTKKGNGSVVDNETTTALIPETTTPGSKASSKKKNSSKAKPNTPVVVTKETKEIKIDNIPVSEHTENGHLEYGGEIRKMLSTGGTLQLTEAQSALLYGQFEDKDIWIKPDGLIYLTWSKIAERLNKAFTGTGWVMIPEGMPKIDNNSNVVFWGFHLVIKGVYCGFSIGEQQYFPDNGRMTYGEACEGAKSNALMRLSKGLGIGLQIWDKTFINRWQKTYAGSRWENKNGKNKQIWFVKDGAFNNVPQNNNQNPTPPPPQAPVNNQQTNTPAPVVNNNDQTIGNSEPVMTNPVNTAKEVTLSPQEKKVAELRQTLVSALTTTALANEYHFVKVAWNKGEITDAQKEILRNLANDLASKLTKQKK